MSLDVKLSADQKKDQAAKFSLQLDYLDLARNFEKLSTDLEKAQAEKFSLKLDNLDLTVNYTSDLATLDEKADASAFINKLNQLHLTLDLADALANSEIKAGAERYAAKSASLGKVSPATQGFFSASAGKDQNSEATATFSEGSKNSR